MTRKMLMYSRSFRDRLGRRQELQYYLLTDEVIFGVSTLEIYGAQIIMTAPDGTVEEKTIRGITPFGTRITAMLGVMADGLVTPSTMKEVVGDLLSSECDTKKG